MPNEKMEREELLLPRSGALRPPGELGHAISPSESDVGGEQGRQKSKDDSNHDLHPAVLQARQEERAAIERNHRARHDAPPPTPVGDGSLVTALCYRGMQIVVGTTRNGCYVICPQTHFLYQTLNHNHSKRASSAASIISLTSCDETGLIVVAHSDGQLHTYLPAKADCDQDSFGPYRWWDAASYDCQTLFSAKEFTAHNLDISLSHNYKFLVAHDDQLAVLSIHSSVNDFIDHATGVVSHGPDGTIHHHPYEEAEIVWTTQLPGKVGMARISGNAYSIAVVLQKNAADDDDVLGSDDGVYTFDHDRNDGSHLQCNTSLSEEGPTQRAPLIRTSSVGILYKPGPFLVHGASVTRMSFRGLGHLSVHCVADEEHGNDLLLTHCARDSVARIFAQHKWKELVDWTTLGNTRVEWIRGISAFTLGDLGSSRSKHSSNSGSMSRVTSEDDIYGTLGKGHPTQSVPHHAQPYSGAGAWISELSFQGALPTLRLSRLAYVQRGIDDAYPTLFECVSSLVPPNTLFSHGILDTTDCGFCVQAIWPAWNPWLSDTANGPDNTETLRGSAMSFLGLASGVSTPGGHFGGSLLGITETPPLELRMTCTHPVGGRVMLLAFRLRGDEAAIDVELPRKAVLSLVDVERFHCGSAVLSNTENRRPRASRQYESGRITARVSTTFQSVDILWRRPGTGSFLPSTWLPGDVDRLGDALAEASVFHDESLLSVPLVESLFHLPEELQHETISDVLWWTTREPKHGGPSYLVTITTGGSIVIFSVPPPSTFLETKMPSQDEWFPAECLEGGTRQIHSLNSEKESYDRFEYEVFITPDPDHGLGLRLESKADGSCAVAGSFKKNPLNGERLPAERTGMICLGDELISANGIGLENQPFEDIIACVRESGASAGPGNPMCLKFRPLRQIYLASSNVSNNTFGSGGVGQTSNQDELSFPTGSVGGMMSTQLVRSSERVESFSNRVACLRDVLTANICRKELDRRFELVPLSQLAGSFDNAVNGALLIAVEGADVHVFSLFFADSVDGARLEKIGHVTVSQGAEIYNIRSLSTFRAVLDGLVLPLWDVQGNLSILGVRIKQEKDIQLSAVFKLHEGAQLSDPASLVSGYSFTLFATMANSDESHRKSIVVHSCAPHPGLNGHHYQCSREFTSQEIILDPSSSGDRIVDFCFLSSGYLNSAPTLVIFSCTGVTLYRKCTSSMEWIPAIKVLYTKIRNSNGGLNSQIDQSLDEFERGFSMLDYFPHLVSDFIWTHQARAEEDRLLSDWYPESLLAYICSESGGVGYALHSHVRNIIRWMETECKRSGVEFLNRSLPCAPIDVCNKVRFSRSETNSSQRCIAELRQQSESDDVLKTFLDEIQISLDEERQTTLLGDNLDSNLELSKNGVGPFFLQFPGFDAQMFLSIGQVALAPPNFQSIDACGQLFLFAASLLQNLDKSEANYQASDKPTKYARRGTDQQSHSDTLGKSQVACSACLAAMICADQQILLERCRPSGEKLDWDKTKKLRIPFWLRSDVALSKVCEEIGQTSFRKDRDIMECAIFFIACGRLRTLKNLAATDQTETGRKFFNFLTSYDFESTRGRLAAEKNAFSLLRKNKYRAAAAFFLLSKPPSLKSAVETILTKLHDIDLAFLVMRLMTNNDARKDTGPSILSLGGGFATASGFIAGADHPDHKENQEPDFDKWCSTLSIASNNFLIDRILPMIVDDGAMASIILCWLNERDLTPWILSDAVGIAFDKQGGHSLYRKDVSDASRDWIITRDPTRSYLPRNVDVLVKSNRIIDIVSRSSILMRLQSPEKPLFMAVLSTSSALISRGLELPALQSLLEFSDGILQKETISTTQDFNKAPDGGTENCFHSVSGMTKSSIFDDFAEQQQQQHIKQQRSIASGMMESSIFDDFAVPPKPKQLQNPITSGAIESSIFEDFVGPPKPKEQQTTSASGAMESSIFDDFAGPPKQQQSTSASDAMESSIFDDFAGSPKPKQQQSTSASGSMESSIFDEFVGPLKLVNEENRSSFGGMNTSLVSGFDGAQNDLQQRLPPHSKNGSETKLQLSLSIDDSPSPQIWNELSSEYICTGAARRLLREIARLYANCRSDPPDLTYGQASIVPPGISSVLQLPCDGESMLTKTKGVLGEISAWSRIDAGYLVQRALEIIGTTHNNRLLFEVVLHCAVERMDLAESAVRVASRGLIEQCASWVPSTDASKLSTRSRFRSSSQFLRKQSAKIGWQLELCLWLHRGDSFPLSGLAINESICAVRLGLLIASWNSDFACMEALVQNPPDCPLDENTGRLLWTSLSNKDPDKPNVKQKGGTSGGWEFLVDCKRSHATEMLKDKTTGCFIIRPHTKDHGVFTLSFKTNLMPANAPRSKEDQGELNPETLGDQLSDQEANQVSTVAKPLKKNDVVQHAIIRLSDSGFRCGSFGPFASLMSLLEAVSASLPFKLRFDKPPANHIIQDEGSQTSPNAVLFHKLAARKKDDSVTINTFNRGTNAFNSVQTSTIPKNSHCNEKPQLDRVGVFSSFLNLMNLLSVCRQLASVVAVGSDDPKILDYVESDRDMDNNSCRQYQQLEAYRILYPFLSWCRAAEILVMSDFVSHRYPTSNAAGGSGMGASAMSAQTKGPHQTLNGDGILRKLIQPGSGVEFSTLRLVDGGECTMVVLFKRNDALQWLVSNGYEQSEADATDRLASMENARYIEPVDLSKLRLKHKGAATEEVITYRFVDPWEVEALENRDAETRAATLGRCKVLGFSLGKVSFALDPLLLTIGGDPLLDLWTTLQGGVMLTKAIASLHPPWERAAGGDLIVGNEQPSQSPYMNSLRKVLYRNSIFRALRLPQRFVTLIQVELLDLKNLTSPGGSLSLTVYALLRPKRAGHGPNLTNKARTLDSASTQPVKLTKSTGPNAPASWGSVVRFRFCLPEDVSIDGTSRDSDQESIFKGPPSFLQLSVYEKKLLVDHMLGSADISMDGLWPGGQLEEWVPLRSDKSSITWFARIRLTLRFELMCLAENAPDREAPSVGLRRIEELSRAGGAAHHEERLEKRSLSSPDLLSYFESMVY